MSKKLNVLRQHNHTDYFASGNLLRHNSKYLPYLAIFCFAETCNRLKKGGTRLTTEKRKVPMYLFGSTIMGSQYPLFYLDMCFHTLPRPYFLFKPNNEGYILSRKQWFMDFVAEIEGLTLHFLLHLHPDKKYSREILKKIILSKNIIPESCRISNSFFTHLTMLGNFNETDGRDIPLHVDKKDVISALVHLGTVSEGGLTLYYNGRSEKKHGTVQEAIMFEHGLIQIGVYDSIPHAVSTWNGCHIIFNFNLKIDVLNHFVIHGKEFYHKYERSNYPSGSYCCF